jgi:hypothetical protein
MLAVDVEQRDCDDCAEHEQVDGGRDEHRHCVSVRGLTVLTTKQREHGD